MTDDETRGGDVLLFVNLCCCCWNWMASYGVDVSNVHAVHVREIGFVSESALSLM